MVDVTMINVNMVDVNMVDVNMVDVAMVEQLAISSKRGLRFLMLFMYYCILCAPALPLRIKK